MGAYIVLAGMLSALRARDILMSMGRSQGVGAGRIMDFFDWHARQSRYWQQRLGFSDYPLLWVAWVKGVIFGAIIVWWWLT